VKYRLFTMLVMLLIGVLPGYAQTHAAQVPPRTITQIAWSPDGNTIAAAGSQGIWLYDANNPETAPRRLGDIDGLVYSVAYHPAGAILAADESRQGGLIHLLDTQTGDTRLTLDGGARTLWVGDLAFSPDGTILAAGYHDNQARLWDAATGELLAAWRGHSQEVMGVAFSPDGTLLATASYDATVGLWDITSQEKRATLRGHRAHVNSVAYSPDGTLLASASREAVIQLWNPQTGENVRTLEGHTDDVEQIAFSPDGTLLASASRDQTIRLWNPATGECLDVLTGHEWWVVAVAFSPDGQQLASASGNGELRIWDIHQE